MVRNYGNSLCRIRLDIVLFVIVIILILVSSRLRWYMLIYLYTMLCSSGAFSRKHDSIPLFVAVCLSYCEVSSVASIYHDFDHNPVSIRSLNFQLFTLFSFKILML